MGKELKSDNKISFLNKKNEKNKRKQKGQSKEDADS